MECRTPRDDMKIRNFESDAEIHQLVAAFEAGTISPAEFKHTAHLAVGLAYLDAGSATLTTRR